jgi:uncharacterized lipoprotein YddW (UPF0748 family)
MRYLILLVTLSFINTFYAQEVPPKRELRAVWVASVTNIDWPSSKNLTSAQQRSELITLLNKHQLNGMNCIMFQIRPSCDAFYMNAMEPWSEWLTGSQGTPPNPIYDPLQFAVEECKKRGIELHAWFNPYRAVLNKNSSSVHFSHISKTHPEWIREYDALKLLDPGIPAVREYVTQVILDVVKRYDIQGVHFDDYFYPYPKTGFTFEDDSTFALYPNGFTDKDDWRRNNINILVQMISDSIKFYKPWVKFGISPFGIWKNSSTDPLGSATSGLNLTTEYMQTPANGCRKDGLIILIRKFTGVLATILQSMMYLFPGGQTILSENIYISGRQHTKSVHLRPTQTG